MDIHEFICKNDVDFAAHLISKTDLKLAEQELKLRFGPQLCEYLLSYGYLGFESAELYGMNARQGLKSDMIRQTQYLHKYYPATADCIAVEHYGEGSYILVDSQDNVFRFVSEGNNMTNTGEKLFDYILTRFREEL